MLLANLPELVPPPWVGDQMKNSRTLQETAASHVPNQLDSPDTKVPPNRRSLRHLFLLLLNRRYTALAREAILPMLLCCWQTQVRSVCLKNPSTYLLECEYWQQTL